MDTASSPSIGALTQRFFLHQRSITRMLGSEIDPVSGQPDTAQEVARENEPPTTHTQVALIFAFFKKICHLAHKC